MGKPGMTARGLRRVWRVWGLYDEIQSAGGLPLTTREAAKRLGFASESMVWNALRVLEGWGVISKAPRQSRSWHVEIRFNEWYDSENGHECQPDDPGRAAC